MTPSVSQAVERPEVTYICWWEVNGAVTLERGWRSLKHTPITSPNHPPPGHASKRSENTCPHTEFFQHVQRSCFHATCVSISRCLDKQILLCPHSGQGDRHCCVEHTGIYTSPCAGGRRVHTIQSKRKEAPEKTNLTQIGRPRGGREQAFL